MCFRPVSASEDRPTSRSARKRSVSKCRRWMTHRSMPLRQPVSSRPRGSCPMSRAKINPTVFLAIALPLVAVAASVGTAVVAVSRGDAPLPDQYHWEGVKLDHDFAQSQRASELQFKANINLQPQKGTCYLALSLGGAAVP